MYVLIHYMDRQHQLIGYEIFDNNDIKEPLVHVMEMTKKGTPKKVYHLDIFIETDKIESAQKYETFLLSKDFFNLCKETTERFVTKWDKKQED